VTGRTRRSGRRPAAGRAPAAAETRPRLIVFSSPVSGPCRRFEGFLAQVIQRGGNHDTFRVHRVDTERRPDLVERFDVDRLPALLVVEERTIAVRLEEPTGCLEIEDALAPWLRLGSGRRSRRDP